MPSPTVITLLVFLSIALINLTKLNFLYFPLIVLILICGIYLIRIQLKGANRKKFIDQNLLILAAVIPSAIIMFGLIYLIKTYQFNFLDHPIILFLTKLIRN